MRESLRRWLRDQRAESPISIITGLAIFAIVGAGAATFLVDATKTAQISTADSKVASALREAAIEEVIDAQQDVSIASGLSSIRVFAPETEPADVPVNRVVTRDSNGVAVTLISREFKGESLSDLDVGSCSTDTSSASTNCHYAVASVQKPLSTITPASTVADRDLVVDADDPYRIFLGTVAHTSDLESFQVNVHVGDGVQVTGVGSICSSGYAPYQSLVAVTPSERDGWFYAPISKGMLESQLLACADTDSAGRVLNYNEISLFAHVDRAPSPDQVDAVFLRTISSGVWDDFTPAVTEGGDQAAAASWSVIWQKYQDLGARDGYLGALSGPLRCGQAEGGCYQGFTWGRIYWTPNSPAVAWDVPKASILDRYTNLNGPQGSLGYPVSGPTNGSKPSGITSYVYQQFSGGTIYWSQQKGAFSVTGEVAVKYAELGQVASACGLPTAEAVKNGTTSQYQAFEGCAIAYKKNIGTFTILDNVSGGMAQKWLANVSGYGFPKTDATEIGTTGWKQEFENGYLFNEKAAGKKAYFVSAKTPVYAAWQASGGPTGTACGWSYKDAISESGGRYAQLFRYCAVGYDPALSTTAIAVSSNGRMVSGVPYSQWYVGREEYGYPTAKAVNQFEQKVKYGSLIRTSASADYYFVSSYTPIGKEYANRGGRTGSCDSPSSAMSVVNSGDIKGTFQVFDGCIITADNYLYSWTNHPNNSGLPAISFNHRYINTYWLSNISTVGFPTKALSYSGSEEMLETEKGTIVANGATVTFKKGWWPA